MRGLPCPAPPVIVPEVGRGRESEAKSTITSMKTLAADVAALKPDTVVLISPHAPSSAITCSCTTRPCSRETLCSSEPGLRIVRTGRRIGSRIGRRWQPAYRAVRSAQKTSKGAGSRTRWTTARWSPCTTSGRSTTILNSSRCRRPRWTSSRLPAGEGHPAVGRGGGQADRRRGQRGPFT